MTPWGYQRGRVRRADLDRATRGSRGAPDGRCGSSCSTTSSPAPRGGRGSGRSSGRSKVLRRLAGAGAELILGGHVHQTTIAERRDFEVVPGEATRLRARDGARPRPSAPEPAHEARGVLVHRADEKEIAVETHVWSGEAWLLTGTRTFPRL